MDFSIDTTQFNDLKIIHHAFGTRTHLVFFVHVLRKLETRHMAVLPESYELPSVSGQSSHLELHFGAALLEQDTKRKKRPRRGARVQEGKVMVFQYCLIRRFNLPQ